ncbi:ferric iron reductase [Streptomyces sp. WZ-12]|uniref:ferric iron reductase n=1 Tax=Streptomyces sp. WZ-12 TaxID=3030210 RepID=UPI0023810D20|nr:ferric iron reductase [Streptomyces sp. WZ-12]
MTASPETDRARRILPQLAGLGRFFDVGTGAVPVGARPWAELATDRAALAGRVDGVALRLAPVERRVAASVMFQGLAARVWSPLIGSHLCHGALLDLSPDTLAWLPAPGGAVPLHYARPAVHRDAAPTLVYERGLRLLEPVAAALRELLPISPRVLWGNSASTVAEALGAVTAARPDLTERARELGAVLTGHGRHAGLGTWIPGSPRPNFGYRRLSCCLYHRKSGVAPCGDCVLRSRER